MNNFDVEWQDECALLRLAYSDTNVFTTESFAALSDTLAALGDSARGIMLCGGDKFFSNGVDLEWALVQSGEEIHNMFMALGHCIVKILESPIPIVGVAKGHAIGAGCAILLACDYRYGATVHVLVGKPEILLGVPNPYYGDQLMRFVAGDFVGSDLIYTGRLVSAEEATTLNLLHGVAEKRDIEKIALEKLEFLMGLSSQAFAESKHMRTAKLCADINEQLVARVARQVEIWRSPEAQNTLNEAAKKLAKISKATP